jgi:hypothetical protein
MIASVLYTLLGLNRAGLILYIVLFGAAVPALVAWFVAESAWGEFREEHGAREKP